MDQEHSSTQGDRYVKAPRVVVQAGATFIESNIIDNRITIQAGGVYRIEHHYHAGLDSTMIENVRKIQGQSTVPGGRSSASCAQASSSTITLAESGSLSTKPKKNGNFEARPGDTSCSDSSTVESIDSPLGDSVCHATTSERSKEGFRITQSIVPKAPLESLPCKLPPSLEGISEEVNYQQDCVARPVRTKRSTRSVKAPTKTTGYAAKQLDESMGEPGGVVELLSLTKHPLETLRTKQAKQITILPEEETSQRPQRKATKQAVNTRSERLKVKQEPLE